MNQPPQPPAWVDAFLRWRLPEDQFEEVQGDLHELYGQWTAQVGRRKATALYLLNAFAFLRPLPQPAGSFGEKNKRYAPNPSTDMLAHFFLLAWRTFRRYRGSFLINLAGLASGLTCVLLIYLWVSDELRMDKFHENDRRLYTVMNNFHLPNGIITQRGTPSPLAEALVATLPEVEYAASVNHFFDWFAGPGALSDGEKNLKAQGIFASRDFFRVFSYPLLHGTAGPVWTDKNSILISEDLARNLFGTTQDGVGKTVTWNHVMFMGPFRVAGVFKNLPTHSTTRFDVVFNYQLMLDHDSGAAGWNGSYAQTYVVVREGTDPDALTRKIISVYKARQPENTAPDLFLQRYSEQYLHGNYENGVPVGGRITYVKVLTLVAGFILLIACINFMNLATAQASRRMKEIGVKQAIGAGRKALVMQFLAESTLMAFLAMLVAIAGVALLLPQFNQVTGKVLRLQADLGHVGVLFGIVAGVGVLAGSYPAFYLSGFGPVAIARGAAGRIGQRTAGREPWVRKGLVVFQFVLSVVFMVGFLVIHEQIDFIQTKNLGYNRDNVLSFDRKGRMTAEKFEAFVAELAQIPGVVRVTSMDGRFVDGGDAQAGYSWRGEESDRGYLFKSPRVGYGFTETLGLQLAAGRAFSREYRDDDSKIMLNESAVRKMSLKDPVGKIIKYGDSEVQVVGVVKDFQYGSLYQRVEPLIFRCRPKGSTMLVKVKAGTERATLGRVESLFRKFHPAYPFEFTFLDAEYQALYQSENRVAVLFNYFTGMAIVISCLGLLGLAAFTAQRRRKEIGIRKVLGASQAGIALLLSSELTRLVLVAVVIALPVSYGLARKWLDSFAHRIDLAWWHFAAAGLLAVLIAWFTVGTQAIGAARANPVHALNQE
ncbi:MAG TPA: ABC transporter permease [Cytophagales bacterium]